MAEVRSLFWKLTKSVIQNCYGCKLFRAVHHPNLEQRLLPRDRTEQPLPFAVVSTDYAGSLYYKSKVKKYLKAYILLLSGSASRAVHLKLVSNLSATEFIKSFKRLISRRRKPNNNIIYSVNTRTSIAGAKWLNSINKDEEFRDFFIKDKIIWKFNLSKAPW